MGGPLRAVFDCNIFWRALFSPAGLGNDCVKLIKDGRILHFMSDETLAEVTDVLTRHETLEKFSSVGLVEAESFIESIALRSVFVSHVPRIFRLPRDPKDEPYIDLAAEVDADFIVTTDNDLLDLLTGIDVESKQFRQQFRHLKIVTPAEFLKLVSRSELPLKP